MNVATTSSATASNTTAAASSTQSSTAKSTSKTAEKSFDEEMKTASKSEDKNSDVKNSEKSGKTNKTDTKNSEKSVKKSEPEQDKSDNEFDEIADFHTEINFTDYKYGNRSRSILSQNIQELIDTKNMISCVTSAQPIEYDSINMSENDADFFVNLVQNTDMSMKNIMAEIKNDVLQDSQKVQKNIQVSSVLMEKLSESLNTNRPFRIDFDKDVSVIIKVNRDGSLSASFIPGDKAVEEYLRNNISTLRQRFDEENLPYSELSYRNSNNKEQQNRKKENDNE